MALIRRESFGRWTRLALSAELALLVLLALAAVVLVVWLAGWRPLRFRADLSRDGQNTLDAATVRLLADFPRDVEIDVFFSPVAGEYAEAVADVQSRTAEVLFLLREHAGEKLTIRDHPVQRPAAREERARELRLTRDQVIVVSSGARRVPLRVETDLATITAGDPRTGAPARVHEFRAEEAIVEALGRVAADTAPRVLFSVAFGESNPRSLDELSLGLLWRALEDEGFELDVWDADRDESIPADVQVLALVGGDQPLTPAALAEIRRFVAAGGGLFVALGPVLVQGAGGAAELLSPYGVEPAHGIVSVPLIDPTGRPRDGLASVMALVFEPTELNSSHPITQPLVERGRRLRAARLRSFDRTRTPSGGGVLGLVSSPDTSWRDLPLPDGTWDWRLDPQREETGRFSLAVASEFRTSPTAPTRARVVALGGVDFVTNRNFETNGDFALNSFNWLSQRDFRVRVGRRDPFQARIDPERGRERPVLANLALWFLPGGAALAGVVVLLARRRH